VADYEQSMTINAPPEQVFSWVSDVGNLPGYLPPVTDASVEGPSVEGTPGQRVRLSLEFPNGSSFDSEGYLSADERERRMEWGAEGDRDYSGWLTVDNHGEGQSEVLVHLSFGERSVEGEIQDESPEGCDPLQEAIGATLESVRRQIEERAGKVQPPPPPEGAQPPPDGAR
jgi:uncharacterized protein YndB with AHSA1/START domain